MPVYEYYCLACKKRYEVIQHFDDSPLKTCEKCGGKVVKVVSECTFHLKGTGWYETDSKVEKQGEKK